MGEIDLKPPSSCKQFCALLFPPIDKYGIEIPLKTRILTFLFPNFKLISFTFIFAIIWAIWNAFIFTIYLFYQNEMKYPFACVLRNFYAGSITPLHKFDREYMRPFIAIFTADDLASSILSFVFILNHGFDYETIFPLWAVLLTIFVPALIGTLTGDFFAINDVRAQGSTLMWAF